MKKTLSLDLGSSSLGWAITSFESRTTSQPEAHGIITFEAGMIKGSQGYSSPTAERREARTARIRLQHRRTRKQVLLKLLIENKMVPLEKEELAQWSHYHKNQPRVFPESEQFKKWLNCDFTYAGGVTYKNPYELRVKGLDEALTPHEFGRVLYHLGQRRGYKDIGEKDKETKNQEKRRKEAPVGLLSLQEAIEKHKAVSKALKYERLDKNEKSKSVRTRNQLIYRHEYEAELILLCEAQGYDVSKNEDGKYNHPLVAALYKTIIWQLPLKSQKGAVGKCTLEPNRRRAPASHPIYEIFRTWQTISNFKYKAEEKLLPLKPAWQKFLFREVFLKHGANFQFKTVREKLNQAYGMDYSYNYQDKHTLAGMPFCKGLYQSFRGQKQVQNKLLKAFTQTDIRDNNLEAKIIGKYSLSDLWHQLYVTLDRKDTTEQDEFYLVKFAETKLGIRTVEGKNPFVELKPKLATGYAKLSLYAMQHIIKFLQVGYAYHDAVLLAHLPASIKDWETNKYRVFELFKQSRFEFELERACNRALQTLIGKYYDNEEINTAKVLRAATTAHRNWQKEATIVYDLEEFQERVQAKAAAIFDLPGRPSFQKTTTTPFQDLFLEKLRSTDIEVKEEKLWHHSNLDNPYGQADKIRNDGILQLPVAQTLSIRNPMFNKALAVLRRLVNHLLRKELINPYTRIVLEIPRGLLNDNNERAAIEKYQKDREKKRSDYRKILEESYFEGQKVTDKHLERYELWEEQKHCCMYTGQTISLQQLFSPEVEIDHTIPQSLFPDNTMMNKTVTFRSYNKDTKGNRLPTECPRYETEIKSRLKIWEDERAKFEKEYKKNCKKKANETEAAKNSRIFFKHYNKMHYDYWHGKIKRFEATEVPNHWARRQLQDTQNICKYARHFLRTVFDDVRVQKGENTAPFRKIYQFGEKNRATHLHHIEDAVILSLIPADPQAHLEYLKKHDGQPKPAYLKFNGRKCVEYLAKNTLVYHFTQDKILKQTFKRLRKRGQLQHFENGNYRFKAGRTVRGKLFKETFFAKLAEGKKSAGQVAAQI